jgi:hypothetical protein
MTGFVSLGSFWRMAASRHWLRFSHLAKVADPGMIAEAGRIDILPWLRLGRSGSDGVGQRFALQRSIAPGRSTRSLRAGCALMTGLNLETFLRLLKADLGVWVSLGVIVAILAVMTWTRWGSKRALRNCLFLSIAVHVGLIVYGASSPAILKALRLDGSSRKVVKTEKPVRITPVVAEKSPTKNGTKPSKKIASWDLDRNSLALNGPSRLLAPQPSSTSPVISRAELPLVGPEPFAPEVKAPSPMVETPATPLDPQSAEPLPSVAEADPSEVAAPVAINATTFDVPPISTGRVRFGTPTNGAARSAPERRQPLGSFLPEAPRFELAAPVVPVPSPTLTEKVPAVALDAREEIPVATSEDLDPGPPTAPVPVAIPSTANGLPGPEIRRAPRPSDRLGATNLAAPKRVVENHSPQALASVTPVGPSSVSTLARPTSRRSLADVPPVYRSRLDPNRTALAQRGGASVASELSVERAQDPRRRNRRE